MNPPATMAPPSTLKETAAREADEAERELEQRDVSLIGKSGGDDEDEEQEQGKEDDADKEDGKQEEPGYVAPQPTEDDLKRANQVYSELKGRAESYSAEQTIEALISIVDIAPALARPEEWPAAEDVEYHKAPQIQEICTLLLKGCRGKLELSPKDVIYLWRNKSKWTTHGTTVRSNTKPLDTRTQFLVKGAMAVIEVNFHHWKGLNPLQKIFTCYRALRQLDKEAAVRHADFEGYFDELELFGPRVFREMAQLKAAIDRGADRELPFQISLFEQADED